VGLGVAAVASLVAVASVAVALGMQAREESARAVAARDFMLSLFKRADQEKSRGADITARELLQTGRADLLKRLADQPRLQGELLMGIGTIQRDMGEYVDADSTFADAAATYARLDMPREEVLARAAHANVVLRMGQAQRAGVLLKEAAQVAGRPAGDAELNARLSEIGGWIATVEGDGPRAREFFRESRSAAITAFGPYHTKTRDAMRGLVYAERLSRNFDGALALQDELEAATAKASDKEPRELPALADLRGDLLDSAGRFAEAFAHVSTEIPNCVKASGAHDEYCRRLFLRKVRVMLKLGHTELEPQDQSFVQQLMDDEASPTLRVEALILRFRMESMRGRTAQQHALSERVLSFAASGADVQINPLLKALAMLSVAEAELRRGDRAQARKRIDDVIERLGSREATLPVRSLTAFAKILFGVSLIQDGQPAAAVPWIRQGQDDMAEVYGAGHPLTTVYALNTAVALAAMGRFQEARNVVAAAEPVLRQAMGPAAPTCLRVRRLADSLERAQTAGDATQVSTEFFS